MALFDLHGNEIHTLSAGDLNFHNELMNRIPRDLDMCLTDKLCHLINAQPEHLNSASLHHEFKASGIYQDILELWSGNHGNAKQYADHFCWVHLIADPKAKWYCDKYLGAISSLLDNDGSYVGIDFFRGPGKHTSTCLIPFLSRSNLASELLLTVVSVKLRTFV